MSIKEKDDFFIINYLKKPHQLHKLMWFYFFIASLQKIKI